MKQRYAHRGRAVRGVTMGREEYTYRSGKQGRWCDYREEVGILGFSWSVRRQSERERRRARFRGRIRRLLWFLGLAAALWLMCR